MSKRSAVFGAVILLLGLMGFSLYQLGAGNRLALSLNQAHKSEVLMYGASWCPACAATREFLNARNQPFLELDMENDPQAAREFAQFGGHGIPLVLIDGRVIRGHSPAELDRLLARLEK
ncbi:glutaredoxin family protein [Ferrimonas balearica]|uniref:glutaredoxin family protein n=1 Tax=Ferrimonas balearica TaxID=44012 RepID=UPI001C996275|nr:glutaredoxin family protein [Ferrimonas balearica]MBY5992198.1 glutaredoxin family protein [Ferrimonas balearica]